MEIWKFISEFTFDEGAPRTHSPRALGADSRMPSGNFSSPTSSASIFMNIRFHFQKVDAEKKKQLENYFTPKKLERLTKLLLHGNLNLATLILHVGYLSHHNNFSVKLDLNFAKHNLVSEETGYNLVEVFDIAFDDLIKQVRKVENKKHDK